jgi:hypothetical protein
MVEVVASRLHNPLRRDLDELAARWQSRPVWQSNDEAPGSARAQARLPRFDRVDARRAPPAFAFGRHQRAYNALGRCGHVDSCQYDFAVADGAGGVGRANRRRHRLLLSFLFGVLHDVLFDS